MKKKEQLENLRSIGMITGLSLLIGIAGYGFIKISSDKGEVKEVSQIADHDIYLYKQDGTLSLFNTKANKYLQDYSISEVSDIGKINTYENVFDLTYNGEQLVVSSPFSKEIIVYKSNNNKLKEDRKIKVNGIIDNFKVTDSELYVHYTDNKVIDVFDFKTGKLENTLTFSDNVTALELDKDNLYIGVGDYIEILPLNSQNTSKSIKIHTGAFATSILKGEDGFLYVGNTFATDSGNSVLLKIDLTKKNVSDILELGKEYPISMFEKGESIYILCQGITDDVLDGISIIDKNSFERNNSISTGDTPNSMMYTEDGYIYVAHEDGKVSIINAKNDFNIDTTFTINGIKNIVLKKDK